MKWRMERKKYGYLDVFAPVDDYIVLSPFLVKSLRSTDITF